MGSAQDFARIGCALFLEPFGKSPKIGLWGDFGGLDQYFGLGTFLGKKWSRKKLFCGGMILWWGFRGIHPAQMNSKVPRTHMGRLLCAQTPLKNKFSANSPKSEKLV